MADPKLYRCTSAHWAGYDFIDVGTILPAGHPAVNAHFEVYEVPAYESSSAPAPVPEPELETGPERPPASGAGSGRDAWVAYAESVGVEVTDDMTRDDIIYAVDEA